MWFLKQQQVFAMIWKCCPHACLASGFLFGFLRYFCFHPPVVGTLVPENVIAAFSQNKSYTPQNVPTTQTWRSCMLLWDASRHISLWVVCCHRCVRLTHTDTQSRGQHIKRHHRWHTLPLTPEEDMSYPTACLSVPTSRIPLCQTATEQIIQSVSSPWWPDLPHTRTPPGWGSEEDWDIHRLLALIILPPEPTADIIRTANVNDADTCGCLRHHEARTMSDKARENTGCVFLVGICFQRNLLLGHRCQLYFFSSSVWTEAHPPFLCTPCPQ